MKKNVFYTDQIFTRACIGSDYSRKEDQLDDLCRNLAFVFKGSHRCGVLELFESFSLFLSDEECGKWDSKFACVYCRIRGAGILALTLLCGAAGLVMLWSWENFVAREAAKDLGVLSTSSIKDGEKPPPPLLEKDQSQSLRMRLQRLYWLVRQDY